MQIRPTVPQDRFIRSTLTRPAFVGGFGSGKTEALIVRSVLGKIAEPGVNRAFYEPTYDLIRMIAWPRFEEILTNLGVPYRLHKHPHSLIEIEGHGQIIFRSMDNPTRIVGYQVGDSDVDELDTLPTEQARDVWRKIISRNRQKKASGKPNTAAIATTPEGFRFVYERWELNPGKGYGIIRAPTYSNPHLEEDYIDSLREEYPEHLLEAYIEGNFVNLTSGTVYVSFDRRKHHSDTVENGKEPLFIGMDFNVGQMAAVVHVKRNGSPHAVDEIVGAYDTPEMIRIIQDRYGKPGRSITVYPDASGGSRRSVDASKTDIHLLKQSGLRVLARKQNPRVRDRINCMNAAFEHKGYRVNVDRCPVYARCLEQQAYDRNGEPDKKQGLDHHPDGAGYFIHYEYPLVRQARTIEMGVSF